MRLWKLVAVLATAIGCGSGGTNSGSEDAANSADASSPADACVPSGDDAPDSTFADTNCDGVDGDAANSIFVASDGNASGAGTMADPLASVFQGIVLAVIEGKGAVLISKGTYSEAIQIAEGVSVYGGYDRAANWSRSAADRPIIAGPSPTLTAEDIATTPTIVNLIRVEAEDGGPAGTSIAARLVRSSAVTLNDVQLVAGNGGDGADAVGTPPPAAPGSPGDLGGKAVIPHPACIAGGGATPVRGAGGSGTGCSCSLGGTGGFAGLETGLDSGEQGNTGQLAMSLIACVSSGGASGGSGALPGIKGFDGDPAANGAAGGNGFGGSLIGRFQEAGYTPANGQEGEQGMPGGAGGGGGGGGGDATGEPICGATGGAGGGGGGGGCGGAGGFGGGGGGASLGVYLWGGSPTFIDVHIQTGNGGLAGGGTVGGSGGIGGLGGTGGWAMLCPVACRTVIGTTLTCTCSASTVSGAGGDGGPGGNGGPGGSAGGGGGGASIGIVIGNAGSLGAESNDITYVLGDAGLGGAGGDVSNNGRDGISRETYPLIAE